MSLDVRVNITKGWPNPSILEESLPADGSATGTVLEAGEIVHINATSAGWQRGVTALAQIPFILLANGDDPSTGRSAHKAGYKQVKYGNIHGVALTNPLEIETTQYDDSDNYAINDELSAPAGIIKLAESTEVIIGTVKKAPYRLGELSYLTFIADPNKRLKS